MKLSILLSTARVGPRARTAGVRRAHTDAHRVVSLRDDLRVEFRADGASGLHLSTTRPFEDESVGPMASRDVTTTSRLERPTGGRHSPPSRIPDHLHLAGGCCRRPLGPRGVARAEQAAVFARPGVERESHGYAHQTFDGAVPSISE
jgi:hypothetical protein